MTDTPKPEQQGELKHHHTDITQSKFAIYIDTYLIDEEGTLWSFRSSSFRFNLLFKGKAEREGDGNATAIPDGT